MSALTITHPGYRDWRITLTDGEATVEVGAATSARRAWALAAKLKRQHPDARVVDGRSDMVARKAAFEARVRR